MAETERAPLTPESTDDEIREAAKRQWEKDGEIEIDNNAVVSRGDDPGAYVQAWVWVYFDEKEDEDNG